MEFTIFGEKPNVSEAQNRGLRLDVSKLVATLMSYAGKIVDGVAELVFGLEDASELCKPTDWSVYDKRLSEITKRDVDPKLQLLSQKFHDLGVDEMNDGEEIRIRVSTQQ